MNEHQEHQQQEQDNSPLPQATEQQPIKLLIYIQVFQLPITDKRKLMLTSLMSMQNQLATEPIEYKGELFRFYVRQQELFQLMNIPKNTFEYNMRWLRDNGYLNYRRGCVPGTNRQTTFFNVNSELVQEQYNTIMNNRSAGTR